MWNFTLGTFAAKWGGLAIFGSISLMLAVYFVASAVVSALTVSIVSIDVSRLRRAKHQYLGHARYVSLLICIPVLLAAVIILCIVSNNIYPFSRYQVAVTSCIYVILNVLVDVLRRFGALEPRIIGLSCVAVARAVLLPALLFLVFFFSPNGNSIVALAATAISLSLASAVALLLLVPRMRGRGFIFRVAANRQIRMGAWMGASVIATSAFEQSLAAAAGGVGSSVVTGGWRAGSYLFGLLGPLLQVADVMLPSLAFQMIGKTPAFRLRFHYFVAAFSLAAIGSASVAVVNATVWLPFLGQEFKSYWEVSYIYAGVFTCIVARTALMPFLKTRAPKLVFGASALGSLAGLLAFVSVGEISATAVAFAVLVANATSLALNAWTFFGGRIGR